jgi:hypothetical protein
MYRLEGEVGRRLSVERRTETSFAVVTKLMVAMVLLSEWCYIRHHCTEGSLYYQGAAAKYLEQERISQSENDNTARQWIMQEHTLLEANGND